MEISKILNNANDESSPTLLDEEAHGESPMAEISIRAILGRTSATTMKVKGELLSKEILILINSDSTHNFISNKLVEDLGIKPQHLAPFGVQVGDGAMISCSAICGDLEIQVQQLTIRDPMI
ncbi:hypothetical protein QN277_003844 [Acacia crassicarpa]|uniref:Uncharacterized protein n=1 Tax=Acacia crassicarpa TaxID=499986 RepID=A0AAE1MD60_9FABA|nr:hypothetical protein QN277_003844 [Acacia crassicarpa]